MRKKIFLAMFLVAGVILLGGCKKKETQQNQINTSKGLSQNKQNTNQQNINNNQQTKENKLSNLPESVKKLFLSGKKIKCVYSDSELGNGSVMVTTYVDTKSKNYKTVFTSAEGKKNTVIFDGETMYMWTEGEESGTKMDQSCIKKLKGSSDVEPNSEETIEDEKDDSESVDIEKKLSQGENVKCEAISSIDLSVPKNVNFVDQCAMLEKQQKALKGLEKQMENIPQMPTGAEPK